jgi:hypothetical protein
MSGSRKSPYAVGRSAAPWHHERPGEVTRLTTHQLNAFRLTCEPRALADRLKLFALDRLDSKGKPVIMNANQVRAAVVLLAKCVPDLTSLTLELKDTLDDQPTEALQARLASVLAGRKVGLDVVDVEVIEKPSLADLLGD